MAAAVPAGGAEVDVEGVGAADIVPLGATVEVTGLPPDAGAGAAWPNIFDIRLVNIPITKNSKAGQMKLPALLLLLNLDGRTKKFAAALPIAQDSAVIEPLAFVIKMLVTEILTKTHPDTVCVLLATLSIPEV